MAYLKGELAAVDAAEEAAADISAGITATEPLEAAASEAVVVTVAVFSRSGRRGAAFGGRGEDAPEDAVAGEGGESAAAPGEGGAEGKTRVTFIA